jgi:glycine/D-amino acid oxidase-like deaminating enzyme
MRINKSPWIHQLDHERKSISLNKDLDTDIAIVGAGIAGVSSAFFILKYTNQRVVLLDQGKLAHGATGHNAGQVIARFEKPLEKLVKEFGFDLVKSALHDLHSAWMLIDEMYNDADLDILFSKIQGARGFSDLYQVILAIKDIEIERLSGIPSGPMLINEKAPFRDLLPKSLESFYKFVPHKEILDILETEDNQFQALVTEHAACMNSALFCQEVVSYLLKKYPDRFSLYENTHIIKTVLRKGYSLLDAGKHTINAGKVVLCTNGFEKIEIFNDGGLAIDKKFHHLVNGRVGYMSGYLEKINKPPTAISYYVEKNDPSNDNPDPYFYLTRRPHDMGDLKHNLICAGGPEVPLNDRSEYLVDYEYPEQIQSDLDSFIKKEYDINPNHKIDYDFTWHGLMGYTPNRVRLIGEEPKNRVLLYNLGCNGIGIIPSVYGGRRISRIIAGEKLSSSIFDPK